MPNVLFDLDSIDLTAVAVDASQIPEYNPQAGAMRQLDHVIHLDVETKFAVGVRQVRHDEFWVPLHIPGRPIMPGVLLIEAAAQLSSVQFKIMTGDRRFLGFARCDEVAFRGQVVPGDTLYLISEALKISPRRFVSRTQGVVNGALIFEAKITGMAV